MATQPTNLPVPSETPRDLKFNAGKIDEFVTSLVNTYIDRFGQQHYTIEGLRWLDQQAIAQYGWIPVGTFQAGATLTLPNQILKDETDGEYYRWDGSFLPSGKLVPAGSTPDSSGGVGLGKWLSVGDSVLRSELAKPSGAGLVGGTITPITATSLAGGAVAGQDSTAAIEAAGTLGGTYYVPKGEYIITSARISKNVTFIFERGASFKRAAGSDVKQSYWNPGVPMIDAIADGLTVTFIDPTFDGNKANQPVIQMGYSGPNATTEPSGWAFRYSPANAATAKDCRFVFVRPTFKNGTSGYLLIRGDDVNRRFRTQVVLDDAVFTDTIYGYGKGDPATPTALGWSSDYIQALDYIDLFMSNLDMSYLAGPTAVGKYAPVGIRGTFFGSNVAVAGGVSIYATGSTKLKGLGRKTQKYDGTDYVTNNGIGAIDGYGDCKNFYFDIVEATDCENVPIRAKATIQNYHINKAILTNCKRGLQVAPASAGASEAIIYVGSVESEGGWNPQIEFIGNSVPDKLRSVHIGQARISGGTNGEGLTANIAGVVLRNITDVTHGTINVSNQDERGFWYAECSRMSGQCVSNTTAKHGIQMDSCRESVKLKAVVQGSPGYYGVTLSGTCKNMDISADVDGADGYGIFANISAGHVSIHDSTAANITGLSRGFYIGAAGGSVNGSSIGTGVGTGLVADDFSQISQYDNSWNARNALYRASTTAPASGDFRRGDLIYMPPSAAGFIGWVCTTAGTAGSTAVFKRFGTIEA